MIGLDYYAMPNVREICHLAKKGDREAVSLVADAIIMQLPEDAVLIPMPSSNGVPEDILELCQIIAERTNCNVWDGLRGASRKSQYLSKKSGIPLTEDDLGFYLIGEVPDGRLFVIDNIIDTGLTMNAALNILPNANPATFCSRDLNSYDVALGVFERIKNEPFDKMGDLISSGMSDSVVFELSRLFISKFPERLKDVINELENKCPNTVHAGLKNGMENGFNSLLINEPKTIKENPNTNETNVSDLTNVLSDNRCLIKTL